MDRSLHSGSTDGDLMTAKILLAGVLTLPAISLSAEERLSLRVFPAVAYAPANLIVRTSIAADLENRAIEIVAESDDFYRSSEIQIDGDRAPRTTHFEFRSLPGGAYSVTAILKGAGGRTRASAHAEVRVMDAKVAR
jgi:hypothetical protein